MDRFGVNGRMDLIVMGVAGGVRWDGKCTIGYSGTRSEYLFWWGIWLCKHSIGRHFVICFLMMAVWLSGYSSCGEIKCGYDCCGCMSISCVFWTRCEPFVYQGYDYIIKTLDYFLYTSSANHRELAWLWELRCILQCEIWPLYLESMVNYGQHVSLCFINSVVLRINCSGNHMWYVSVWIEGLFEIDMRYGEM